MSKFKKLLSKKEELEAQLETLKGEFDIAAKEEFQVWAKDLFQRYEPLKFISWTGYTPSFNDGDPCYFRSSHTYYSINTEDSEEIDEEGFEKEQLEVLQKEVNEFLGQFDDDDMERLFGNDVRVTVTAEGVEVESYDCGY